jgi:hypothetical protein
MSKDRQHKRIHGDSGDKVKKSSAAKPKNTEGRASDDFISVARRLGADEDKATFEAKLAKIAKAKATK